MKKRTLVSMLAITLAMIFALAGCGGKKENSSGDKNSGSKKPAQTDDDDWADIFDDDYPDDTQQSAPDQPQAQPALRLYDRAAEWNDLTMEDFAVQICDTVYYPGESTQDFIKKTNSSAVTFEMYSSFSRDAEINLNKLVSHGSNEHIYFFCDDRYMFTVRAYNPFSDMTALKDLPILDIKLEREAYPYCRFFDGTWSYDDIMALDYSNASELVDYATRLGYRVDISGLLYYFRPLYDIPIRKAAWTGTLFEVSNTSFLYYFSIDADTSKADWFSSWYTPTITMYSPNKYRGKMSTNIAHIQNLDSFWESVENEIQKNHPEYIINERIGVISLWYNANYHSDGNLLFICRVNDTQYAVAYLTNMYSMIDYDGNIVASAIYTKTAFDDLESLFNDFEYNFIISSNSEALTNAASQQ